MTKGLYIRTAIAAAAALATLAMTAVASPASTRPDDRAGVRATPVEAPVYPDAFERAVAAHYATRSLHPDDRAGIRGDFPATSVIVAPQSSGGSFEWADAGVGAASVAVLTLLAASGLLATRRMRHHSTA